MEYGEVGGIDVDFDHLFITYRYFLTLGLLDGLVAEVANTIKATTPLEVEAVDREGLLYLFGKGDGNTRW